MKNKSEFQKLLKKELKNPEFAKAFTEESEKLDIALKIQKLRVRKGITQEELAKRIGTSQSVISRIENANYKNHTLSMLIKIAKAMDAHLTVDFE